MPEDPSADGLISEDELKRLTELFIQFEGATDPRSRKCREAEVDFDELIDRLFTEKVEQAFKLINRFQFKSFARHICRERASKIVKQFPCP